MKNKKTGAKKRWVKAHHGYTFCHWYEYYKNKLGKLKVPNYVKKIEDTDL
jgi:hypothetical protein